MGTLLSSGHTLDDILDLSFEHIEVAARCIMRHKISMYEMVMEPIAAGLGSKSAKKSLAKKKAESDRLKKKDEQSHLTPEQKDKRLMANLRFLGFDMGKKE